MERMQEPNDRERAVKYHPLDMIRQIYSELIPTPISRSAQDRPSQQSITDRGGLTGFCPLLLITGSWWIVGGEEPSSSVLFITDISMRLQWIVPISKSKPQRWFWSKPERYTQNEKTISVRRWLVGMKGGWGEGGREKGAEVRASEHVTHTRVRTHTC